MKKTIEELLSGNFRHEHPQLLFSQDKIEVTLKAGDVYKGELYFGTEDNEKIIRKYVDILHLPTGAWYREPRNFRELR